MTMTKLNEITAKPFASFNAQTSPTYSSVIGDISADSLDVMFNALYHDRTVFDNFIEDSALNETVLSVIWQELAPRWSKIREYLELDYSPINPYHESETYKRDYSSNESGTSKDNGTDNVAGFDSTTPVVDTTNEDTGSDTNERTDTESYTKEKSGNVHVIDQAQLIESSMRLRENKFVDILLKDVGNALTLSIYE